MRSCDPQEVPRLQSGGAFYAPRRIRTAPSWMPFFTHLQLGLLCRDERVARVCELLAARRVKSSLHLYIQAVKLVGGLVDGKVDDVRQMIGRDLDVANGEDHLHTHRIRQQREDSDRRIQMRCVIRGVHVLNLLHSHQYYPIPL